MVYSHESPHLFDIFISFHCYWTVRSFVIFHIISSSSCASQTRKLLFDKVFSPYVSCKSGNFLQFHEKFDVNSLLIFLSSMFAVS